MNFSHVKIVEPFTGSGSYKAEDGNYYYVIMDPSGVTRIVGMSHQAETAERHQQLEAEHDPDLLGRPEYD